MAGTRSHRRRRRKAKKQKQHKWVPVLEPIREEDEGDAQAGQAVSQEEARRASEAWAAKVLALVEEQAAWDSDMCGGFEDWKGGVMYSRV